MGFSSFGQQSLSFSPASTARNTIRPLDIFTPGVAVTMPNGFASTAYEAFVAGEAYPRARVTPGSLRFGTGATDPETSLDRMGPVGTSTVGTFAQGGVRFSRLGWFNVKEYGAVGNGVADDTAAIQAALNVGAGTVYLPPGTYLISAALQIGTATRLLGAGPAISIIKAASSMVVPMIQNTGILEMANSIGIGDVVFQDFGLDGNKANRAADTFGHGIWLRGGNTAQCDGVTIKNVWSYSMPGMGFALQNVIRVMVEGCEAYECTRDGISFWGNSVWVNVVGNRIIRCGDDNIALNATTDNISLQHIFADMRDIAIVGNVCGPAPTGGPFGNGVACSGARRVTIANNVVLDQLGDGIRVVTWHSTTTTNSASDVVISGNTVTNSGSVAGGAGNGIVCGTGQVFEFDGGGSSNGSISRVTISDNTILGSRGHGVWIATSTGTGIIEHIKIQGNTIRGVSPDALSSGILVGGTTSLGTQSQHYASAVTAMRDVEIQGNTVSHNANYGVRCHGVTRPTITNNQALENGLQTANAGISAHTCSDTIIRGNRAMNLTGSGGQTYGIGLNTVSGVSMVSDNWVGGNDTDGIINSSPVTGGFNNHYLWHNIGSPILAAPPPN